MKEISRYAIYFGLLLSISACSSQVAQNSEDCGSIAYDHIVMKSEERTPEERKTLFCMSKALQNCQSASFKQLGTVSDGMTIPEATYEVGGKEDQTCTLSMTMHGEIKPAPIFETPNPLTCKFPMELIQLSVEKLKAENKEEELVPGIATISAFSYPEAEYPNEKTGGKMKVVCK